MQKQLNGGQKQYGALHAAALVLATAMLAACGKSAAPVSAQPSAPHPQSQVVHEPSTAGSTIQRHQLTNTAAMPAVVQSKTSSTKNGSAASPASLTGESAQLVGEWSSQMTDATAGGVMKFGADGSLTLAPIGFDAVSGTWRYADGWLTLRTSMGEALMAVRVAGDEMVLSGDNGLVQTFTRCAKNKCS